MIRIINKKECCGCSACASVCPKDCITILQDSEGFYYPEVNEDGCINCGLCEKKCPVLNNQAEKPFKQTGYVVQHRDSHILKESTSGGAFTGLVEHIIREGGVVVGATLNQSLFVEHIIVDNVEDLSKFRNSKYVQSYIAPEIYKQIKSYLTEGRSVCFSGTACQIEAVKSLFEDKFDKLICIDVVCRAVPSPLAFKKYTEYQTARNHAKIESLRFRDKFFSYHFSTLNIGFDGRKKHYHRGIESDPWHRAFFSGICNRPSCHDCVFKKRYRVSDITLWDCFNYEQKYTSMKRNLGATNVLIHSPKGLALFKKVKESFIVEDANPDEQVARMKEMTQTVPANNRREAFLADAKVLNGVDLYNKYFPIGFKNNLLFWGRRIMVRVGVYSLVKSILR